MIMNVQERLEQIQLNCKKYFVNEFQCRNMCVINNALKSNGINMNNVDSTHILGGLLNDNLLGENPFIMFTTIDWNYNQTKYFIGDKNKWMGMILKNGLKIADEKVADIVMSFYEKLINEKIEKLANEKNTMPIDAVYNSALDIAKEVLNGTKYNVAIEYGKTQVDKDKYYSIVVREKGNYIGSLVLSKNKFGEFYTKVQVPLCGSYEREFNPNDLSFVKESINYIIG